MSQTRKGSAVEAVTGTLIGFVVAYALTFFLLPWWGLKPSAGQAVEITLIYTVVSLLRGYFVRRLFEGKKND